MKDPNDFMLVESEGEQVKRLTAELAHVKRDLIVTSGESDAQADRIRALEAGIELYKVELAVANEGWLAADKLKLDAQNQLSAELALRQSAEGYAARNALRVIAVESELAELKKHIPLKGGVPLRQYVLETALREISKDNFLYKSTQIAIKALNPPQTETACTCDSTLVTATSNHQPHCPRYVAETKGDAGG